MSVKDILTKKKTEFDEVIEFYKKDISSIRTGRASASMVEDIMVDAYGSMMRIQEIASVSIPEARTIAIQPWDKGMVEPISSAIRKSDLGLAPIADGQIIRLNIPPLTEDRRKEFVKLLKKKSEDARIHVRQAREGGIREVEGLEKEGEISEDEKFRGREEIQRLVDSTNKEILEIEAKKETEIMSN